MSRPDIPRPLSFWAIAIAALVWNLIGVAMFLTQMALSPESLAAIDEARARVVEATPVWITIAFAVAVFGGALASLMLLLGRRVAVTLYMVSLLALLVQVGGSYAVTPAWAEYGIEGAVLPVLPVLLIIIAAFLVDYSGRCEKRGWVG